MGIGSKIMFAGVTLYSITAAISGCKCKEQEESIDEYLTPSLTPFQTDSTVASAPKQLFLHPNSSETFQFRDHNTVATSYLSRSPYLFEVTTGGDTEAIEIKRSTKCPENHYGYYATRDDINYSIKLVVWRYSKAGDKIWSFGTWNSSELYFEVHIRKIIKSVR